MNKKDRIKLADIYTKIETCYITRSGETRQLAAQLLDDMYESFKKELDKGRLERLNK